MLGISTALVTKLCAAAAASPGTERCGLLFGSDARIDRDQPCANVAADPARTFEIDPAALFAAMRAERAGGAKLIGYWHSHPSGDVRPSATDAAMAAPDRKLWVIVSAGEIGIWRAVGEAGCTRFEAVAFETGEEA